MPDDVGRGHFGTKGDKDSLLSHMELGKLRMDLERQEALASEGAK